MIFLKLILFNINEEFCSQIVWDSQPKVLKHLFDFSKLGGKFSNIGAGCNFWWLLQPLCFLFWAMNTLEVAIIVEDDVQKRKDLLKKYEEYMH